MTGFSGDAVVPANEVAVPERRLTPGVSRILDIGERIFAILLAIPFLWAFAISLSMHPTFILVVASEMLSVLFILVRRGGVMAATPIALAVAFAGTGLPLLARPSGASLVPALVSTSIMAAGLGLSILSKLYPQ